MRALVVTAGWLLWIVLCAVFIIVSPAHAASDLCKSYRLLVQREGLSVYGLNSPTPMFIAQIRQESSCRDNITAADGGMGPVQFMAGTATMVSNKFPELGPPDPYNRKWAIRGMIRLDKWNESRIKAKDDCERRGAALKGYNAGIGYVQQAQKTSPDPLTWFGVTEFVPTRQSAKNFEYSRLYPIWILGKHQRLYADWGPVTCEHYMKNGFPSQK